MNGRATATGDSTPTPIPVESRESSVLKTRIKPVRLAMNHNEVLK